MLSKFLLEKPFPDVTDAMPQVFQMVFRVGPLFSVK